MLKHWYQAKKPRKIGKYNNAHYDTSNRGKYDAIVVGAGPAGASAAYFMAKQGLTVLLLERGPFPGAKVCGGTSLISEHTHKLFPNFWDECPCERIVTQQAYWLMTEDSLLSTSFQSTNLAAAPYNHITVKRKLFYQWLVDKGMAVGVDIHFNHHVTEVLFENNQAVGVQVSPPQNCQFFANIIILADGANAMVGQRSGLVPRVSPQDLALYVKETIALPAKVIEERFNLLPGYGSLIGVLGYPTAGFNGTSSIHTFKDCINLNVGMAISDFAISGIRPYDLLDRIKKHPLIKPLLLGGTVLEYGAAVIPEGGYHAVPELVHPGLMILGDAGSLVNGTHGINLAMWSGFFAAQAANESKKSRDFSIEKLSLYRTLLDESFIMQDLKANAKIASLQRDLPYLFDLYSKIVNQTAFHVAKVYTMPKKAKRIFIFKKITSIQPLLKMASDIWKVLKVVKG
ncbi:FAD-dependent oxidoreductase [Pelosinus fermentans]|uniref:FixC-like C-terminal domain-containing protein n=1 Tax=Pelosinus fermentans JBW45 TaxID=1192197 RepID=I9NQB8_9FIRM|nr:FAD-dependent oxidoreductase [Pelosinus fermentans]AJQ28367.1 hypothetical protein JBW_03024 [Pelosinus fermentans JBW45]